MNINRRDKERDAHDLALYRKPVAHATTPTSARTMVKKEPPHVNAQVIRAGYARVPERRYLNDPEGRQHQHRARASRERRLGTCPGPSIPPPMTNPGT